jgi:hypothetical protein
MGLAHHGRRETLRVSAEELSSATSNAPAIGERVVIHAGARPIKGAEIEDLLARLGDRGRQARGSIRRSPGRCSSAAGRPPSTKPSRSAARLGTAVLGRPRNASRIFARPHRRQRSRRPPIERRLQLGVAARGRQAVRRADSDARRAGVLAVRGMNPINRIGQSAFERELQEVKVHREIVAFDMRMVL